VKILGAGVTNAHSTPRQMPSMDKGTELPKPTKEGKRRDGAKVMPRVSIVEKTISADVPPGSRFKGREPFLVQDLVISVCTTCYQRERWVTSDRRTILASLPEVIERHFSPILRRFVLMQYHQGRSTLPGLLASLRSVGVSLSKRQLQRLPTEKQDIFITEARDVLRAALEASPG
jgi:hypothetical protein